MSVLRPIPLLLGAALLAGLASSSYGRPKQAAEDDVDHVSLAARMVQDGHYPRARQVLEEVDENDKDLDRKLYFVLRGLVALNDKLYLAAATNFEAAIKAGNTAPLVYINLARSRFGAKDYKGTVAALRKAGQAAREEPRAELLLCQAHWELGQPAEALAVVARASQKFPESIELARLEMIYLMKLELYQELARQRTRFLKRSDIEAVDLVAIGEALRKSGHLDVAKSSLEAARLRFPDDLGLTVMLARVFMDVGELLSSAMLLEQAARQDDKYLVESAEMYRRAGRLTRALIINKRIPEQVSKMRQRLQILLELQRFEMVAAMQDRLSRLGLLEDQQIRYALAYGLFQTRDFEAAELHIQQLSDPAFFEKGVALRQAIESCKQAGWSCE